MSGLKTPIDPPYEETWIGKTVDPERFQDSEDFQESPGCIPRTYRDTHTHIQTESKVTRKKDSTLYPTYARLDSVNRLRSSLSLEF